MQLSSHQQSLAGVPVDPLPISSCLSLYSSGRIHGTSIHLHFSVFSVFISIILPTLFTRVLFHAEKSLAPSSRLPTVARSLLQPLR